MDDGFGGPPGGLAPDAAADQHGTIILEELVFSPVVLAFDPAPLLDQRTDFALEGGHDGDFGGVRQC